MTGTAGNDTINAVSQATAAATTDTLTITDVIDGGAGTDTLNITVTAANTDVTDGATIKNVEFINIRSTAATTAGTASIAATGLEGVSASGTGDITVTALASGKSFSANGATGAPVISQGYAAAATSAVTNVNGSTLGTVTLVGAGITSATINSSGTKTTTGAVDLVAAKSIAINAAADLTVASIATTGATATLTVTGAGKVDTGTALDADITTVNATANTGGVSVVLGNTLSTKFTGGSGNDTVTTNGVQTGAIDAGAGTGDKLIVGNAADIAATPAALFTNFEVLRNTGGGATLDVSTVAGITSIELGATGQGATKMTAVQAAAVTNLVDNATQTLALTTATGTSDVLSVTLKNATATASADLTAATVTGFETVNIVSSSGSKDDINSLAFAAAGDLTALNISGAQPISIATANITKAAAINASAVTYAAGASATDYALTLSGALVKGSAVTGTGVADSITTSAAVAGGVGDFVTYDAGAGNDAISTTVAALNNNSGANASLKIEGGAGTDTLTITDAGGLTLVDANVQFVTGVEKIGYAVANQAISITTGGFFDTNFKATGVTLTLGDATNAQSNTVNLGTFTGASTVTLTATAATTQDQVITTGSGADKVTVSAAGTTTGDITVNTGAGDDTISITAAAALAAGAVITANGGAGQDAITLAGVVAADAVYAVINVAAGQSTLLAFDSITGYVASAGGATEGMQINFDGTADAAATVVAGAVTGYTGAELTYSITAGVLSFAGTSAAALTNAQKATLAQTLVTAANAVVAWSDGTDAYVFHNDTNGDSLVKLVGITTVGGVDDAAANTLTANYIIV